LVIDETDTLFELVITTAVMNAFPLEWCGRLERTLVDDVQTAIPELVTPILKAVDVSPTHEDQLEA